MSEREEPLEGGNLSVVVRVGETVRRPTGPWTPAVHALLDHLEAKGFPGSPRARGLDEQGREILTFLPGDTIGVSHPWPGWSWTDETLDGIARLLRSYHDAVRDFVPPADGHWRLTDRALRPGEIICHNDVAPYNLVRRANGDVSLIDWDIAGPGPPEDDVAFMACAFVPLHPDAECRNLGVPTSIDRFGRLRRLADGYGLTAREGFVDHMLGRLTASIDRITNAAASGDPAFQQLIANGRLEPVRAQRVWIEANRGPLCDALLRESADTLRG